MSNMDPTKNRGSTQVLAKSKQTILLIRHPRIAHIYIVKKSLKIPKG
jgi:hypothetical protein